MCAVTCGSLSGFCDKGSCNCINLPSYFCLMQEQAPGDNSAAGDALAAVPLPVAGAVAHTQARARAEEHVVVGPSRGGGRGRGAGTGHGQGQGHRQKAFLQEEPAPVVLLVLFGTAQEQRKRLLATALEERTDFHILGGTMSWRRKTS